MKTRFMLLSIPCVVVLLASLPDHAVAAAAVHGAAAHAMHCPGPTLIPVDGPPPKPEFAAAGGGFRIVPVVDFSTSLAQKAVIQQAVNEWNAILLTSGVQPGTWNVPVVYSGSNNVLLANTGVTYAVPSGVLLSAGITIFTNYNWYVDPNPADDVEFQASPPPGFDLLTVMRHELGHAIGWIASPRVANLVSGDVFDAARLNIGMAAGDIQHADPAAHPDEVMQPAIGGSTRRPIRLYPTAALLSRAYEYTIPMHFVDPAYGGTQTGTAWQPWRTLLAASVQSPGLPLLLAPATHHVAVGQTFLTPHRWEAARGGASVIAP